MLGGLACTRLPWNMSTVPGLPVGATIPPSLHSLDTVSLSPDAVQSTLGVLLKYQDDLAKIRGGEVERLVAEARSAAQ